MSDVESTYRKADTATDDAVESLCRRLGRLDPLQVAIWRTMSPAGRLEIAFQAYQLLSTLGR